MSPGQLRSLPEGQQVVSYKPALLGALRRQEDSAKLCPRGSGETLQEAPLLLAKPARKSGYGQTHPESTFFPPKLHIAPTGQEKCLQVPTPAVRSRAKFVGWKKARP